MKMLPFTKMQALGNDFVVIDATKIPFTLTPNSIRCMADRRLGVGFDQLLVLEVSHDKKADFVYRIFNADGGEVAQCGNGARCMALFIHDCGLSGGGQMTLKTQHGYLMLQLHDDGSVEVDMGEPKIDVIGYDGFILVDMGNPHAVCEVDNLDQLNLKQLGERLGNDDYFEAGVNVGAMQRLSPSSIRLRVYERGAGLTQACGSGACAAVAAGRSRGVLDAHVQVQQPGGDLKVHWEGPGHRLRMRGPAAIVYYGEWPLGRAK